MEDKKSFYSHEFIVGGKGSSSSIKKILIHSDFFLTNCQTVKNIVFIYTFEMDSSYYIVLWRLQAISIFVNLFTLH
jgi:hypothetical protein